MPSKVSPAVASFQQKDSTWSRLKFILRKNLPRVVVFRLLFTIGLLVVAAVVGLAALFILQDQETKLYKAEFGSLSNQILDSAVDDLKVITAGANVLASVIGNAFPNATQWPYVALPGYQDIAMDLIKLTSASNIGFTPLVYSDQQAEFEEFAYAYYEADPSTPAGTANHSFGQGIFAVNPSLPNKDKRYHDSGKTYWGSPNILLAPSKMIKYCGVMICCHRLHHIWLIEDVVCARMTRYSCVTSSAFIFKAHIF